METHLFMSIIGVSNLTMPFVESTLLRGWNEYMILDE
jgi:hypothetical protein